MNEAIAWTGFLGTWLLVAGPLAIVMLGGCVLNTAVRMARDQRAAGARRL